MGEQKWFNEREKKIKMSQCSTQNYKMLEKKIWFWTVNTIPIGFDLISMRQRNEIKIQNIQNVFYLLNSSCWMFSLYRSIAFKETKMCTKIQKHQVHSGKKRSFHRMENKNQKLLCCIFGLICSCLFVVFKPTMYIAFKNV